MTRLAAIRARLNVATPGPWFTDKGGQIWRMKWACKLAGISTVNENREADADLIAHAPSDLGFLLARVEQLTQAGEYFVPRRECVLGAKQDVDSMCRAFENLAAGLATPETLAGWGVPMMQRRAELLALALEQFDAACEAWRSAVAALDQEADQ